MLCVMICYDQEFVIEECSQVLNFLPMYEKVQNTALKHLREHNSSISNTAKNGIGNLLTMYMKVKHIVFAHPRERKSAVRNIEKMAQVTNFPLQLIFF